MVSIKELQRLIRERENQKKNLSGIINKLSDQQKEALGFTNVPIPKRRFGASVFRGKARQKDALTTREQAKDFIKQKELEKQQVQEQINLIESNKRSIEEEVRRRKKASKDAVRFFQSSRSQSNIPTDFQLAVDQGAVGSSAGGGFIDTSGKEFFVGGASFPTGEQGSFKIIFNKPQQFNTGSDFKPSNDNKFNKRLSRLIGFPFTSIPVPKVSDQAISEAGRLTSVLLGTPVIDELGILVRPVGQKGTLTEGTRGFVEGQIKFIRDEPIIAGVTFIGGGALAGGSKLLGFGSRRLGGLISTEGSIIAQQVTKGVVVGAGAGLTGVFAIDTVKKISSSKSTFETGEILGKATSEIGAFGLGAKAGGRLADISLSKLRTIGLKELPIESLVDPKVLSGQQQFPRIKKGSNINQLKQSFFEPVLPGEQPGIPRGFTASDIQFPKKERIPIGRIVTVTGGGKRDILTGERVIGETIKSEFPGRFIDPKGISLAFLRQSGESGSLKLGLDPLGTEPTVIRQTLKGIVTPSGEGKLGITPKRVAEVEALLGGRRGLTPEEIINTEPLAPKGTAVIPFIKTEPEAIIVKDTKVGQTSKRFFFKFDGISVPIIEKGIIESSIEKELPNLKLKIKSGELSELTSSVAGRRSSSLNPASSSILAISSLKSPKSIKSSAFGSSSLLSSKLLSEPKISQSSRSSIKSSPFSSSITLRSLTSSPRSPPRSPPRSAPRSAPRSPPIKIPPILLKSDLGRSKPRKKKKGFEDDLFLAGDLTARVIGKTSKIKEKDLLKIASRGFSGLEIRGTPRII